MSVRQLQNVVYGLTDALTNVPLLPIIANRMPASNDMAALGTIWVDKPQNVAYVLTSIVNNEAIWINIAQSPGDFVQFNVQTIGNVAQSLLSIPMAPSSSLEVSGNLTAAQDTFADGAGGLFEGSFIRIGNAAPVQIGNNAIDIDSINNNIAADFAIAGNDVEFNVQGPVGATWNWRAEVSTIVLT